MKRRTFLRNTGLAAAWATFQHQGQAINPMAKVPFLRALAEGGNSNDRVLVLIELNGGNDGLNTFIPLDQMDNLAINRPQVLIPQNLTLGLNGTIKNALHPSMPEFRDLYNDGKMSVVQNVGYPNQDYSHFRSMDIWMSGANSDQYLETGWAGRYMQSLHPDFPEGYPNAASPDPLAIQIGATVSLALMGNVSPVGMGITDPTTFYQFVSDIPEPAPNTPYGHELEFVRLVTQQAQAYYNSVKAAAAAGENLATYPTGNNLADQLKIVANLISGGLTTPIYIVSMYGFDTHADQVDGTFGNTEGIHANLLRTLSEAVGAFQKDLEMLGIDDRVAGMTFSEFGRTIASNASDGTDHGAAAPLFVFGKNVIPGIIGDNPEIPDNPIVSYDVAMQHDFRAVYASALKDWFGVANPEDILGQEFPILPIFKAASSGTHVVDKANSLNVSNFPNPFHSSTTFTFTLENTGYVTIHLIDINGRELKRVAEGSYPTGTHRVLFNRNELPSGHYFYQVKVDGKMVTKHLVVN
ncbi:MAG TPA: hypothetical protein DCF33_15370 [Saprospirales bacterium]|nr:hypothetical protein [Saprospirales bacterium]